MSHLCSLKHMNNKELEHKICRTLLLAWKEVKAEKDASLRSQLKTSQPHK